MNEIATEKTMTTRELAKQLGTSPKVVLENAKKCLPNKKIENGKATYWTKEEVTVLLEQMKSSNLNQYSLYWSGKGYIYRTYTRFEIKESP